MVKVLSLDGVMFKKMIINSCNLLEQRKNSIDALNVFPVPDGDTGTNMSLTFLSATKAIIDKDSLQLNELAEALSYGALMGARGNSGVILSQFLGGFSKGIDGKEVINGFDFVKAFQVGVDSAYSAVLNPIEGTILTVAKEAGFSLEVAKNSTDDLIELFNVAYLKGSEALQNTPNLLPVLKQAGVVDAGGQGLLVILEGMLEALQGKAVEQINISETLNNQISLDKKEFDLGDLEFQYCTEFILKSKDNELNLDNIKQFLSDKGDCLLVVGNSDTSKIHIHTNNPGLVLEYCTNLGTLHKVQIHNMEEQSQEMQVKVVAQKKLGIVAVAMGEGLGQIIKSLGVDVIVSGGQTMNPSTEDLLQAIDKISAEEVIILPNNSNIVLAAQQAEKLAQKPVYVVPSKTVPQGISALMAYNPESNGKINAQKMSEAMKQVISAEVTYSVRNTIHGGKEIKEGNILGIVNGNIEVIEQDIATAVEKIISSLTDNHPEIVTVYYGQDISEGEAENLIEKLANSYPNLDFELHNGGQPLYYYLMSIE